jgi:hypothetical protein
MELEIVWRNPLPLARIEHTLHKISSDEFGAVYRSLTRISRKNLS